MNKTYSSSNFYGKVFKLALPIAAQSTIVIGVNMLDTMMVGKLGDDPLAATSLANSFISVFQIFCMGLGMGASVLVSRYWGMKQSSPDRSQADEASVALKQTISLMLRLTVILAFLFAAATYLAPGIIMRSYTEEEPIINLGIKYFNYSIPTYFFLGISLTSTRVLRSVGQVIYPLIVSIGAFFVNFSMNYILYDMPYH